MGRTKKGKAHPNREDHLDKVVRRTLLDSKRNVSPRRVHLRLDQRDARFPLHHRHRHALNRRLQQITPRIVRDDLGGFQKDPSPGGMLDRRVALLKRGVELVFGIDGGVEIEGGGEVELFVGRFDFAGGVTVEGGLEGDLLVEGGGGSGVGDGAEGFEVCGERGTSAGSRVARRSERMRTMRTLLGRVKNLNIIDLDDHVVRNVRNDAEDAVLPRARVEIVGVAAILLVRELEDGGSTEWIA